MLPVGFEDGVGLPCAALTEGLMVFLFFFCIVCLFIYNCLLIVYA